MLHVASEKITTETTKAPPPAVFHYIPIPVGRRAHSRAYLARQSVLQCMPTILRCPIYNEMKFIPPYWYLDTDVITNANYL